MAPTEPLRKKEPAAMSSVTRTRESIHPGLDVHKDPITAGVTCEQTVSTNLPLTILAAHQSAPLVSARVGKLTNRRWITAPAWLFGVGGAAPGMPTPFFYVGPLDPYVVPATLLARRPRASATV